MTDYVGHMHIKLYILMTLFQKQFTWQPQVVHAVLKIYIFLDVDFKNNYKNSLICYVNFIKMHVYDIGTSDNSLISIIIFFFIFPIRASGVSRFKLYFPVRKVCFAASQCKMMCLTILFYCVVLFKNNLGCSASSFPFIALCCCYSRYRR